MDDGKLHKSVTSKTKHCNFLRNADLITDGQFMSKTWIFIREYLVSSVSGIVVLTWY